MSKPHNTKEYTKLYTSLGWRISPVTKNKKPFFEAKKVKTKGVLKTSNDDWIWNDRVWGIALHTGPKFKCQANKEKCNILGHGCGSNITAPDFDAIKDKDPTLFLDGNIPWEKMAMEQFGEKDYSQLPFPVIKTPNGYRALFSYTKELRSGNNRLAIRYGARVSSEETRIPLVDLKNDHGFCILPSPNNGYEWVTPPPWSDDWIDPPSMKSTYPLLYNHLLKYGENDIELPEIFNPKSVVAPHIDVIRDLVMMFGEYINDYQIWINVGIYLRTNYGSEGKELWLDVCEMYSYDQKQSSAEHWKSFPKSPSKSKRMLTDGSFHKYAKLGSPSKYKKWKKLRDQEVSLESMDNVYSTEKSDEKVRKPNPYVINLFDKLNQNSKLEEAQVIILEEDEDEESILEEEIEEEIISGEEKVFEDTSTPFLTKKDVVELLSEDQHLQASCIARLLDGNLICYDNKKTPQWLRWCNNQKLWIRSGSSGVLKMVGEVIIKAYSFVREHQGTQEEKQRHALIFKNLNKISIRRDLIQEMSSMLPDISKIYQKLNSVPHLFPLRNGRVIDLTKQDTKKAIRERTKDDYFTITSERDLPKELGTSFFTEYMSSLFPEEEERNFIQVVCGVFLTGETLKKMYTLIGEKHSGKSKFMRVLKGVLGDFAGPLNKAVLLKTMDASAGAATPHLVPLLYLRLGTFSETSENAKLNSESIKSLTGDDYISIRANYGDEIECIPRTKLMLATNNIPINDYLENASLSRQSYWPFKQKFTKDPKDGELKLDPLFSKKYLTEEALDKAFEWMVIGAMTYYRNGQNVGKQPEAFKVKKREVVKDMDTIKEFFVGSGCVVITGLEEDKMSSTILYTLFCNYCKSCNYQTISFKKFSMAVASQGNLKKGHTKKGNIWIGIKEPSDSEEEEEEEDGGKE